MQDNAIFYNFTSYSNDINGLELSVVVQVSLTLAVSIDDFFVQNLISNLAYILKINPSTIRVVQIIAESAPFTGKRSLLAVNDTSLTLELGAPPPNTTAVPVTPSVDAQLATSGGQRSVDVVVSSINHYPELHNFATCTYIDAIRNMDSNITTMIFSSEHTSLNHDTKYTPPS